MVDTSARFRRPAGRSESVKISQYSWDPSDQTTLIHTEDHVIKEKSKKLNDSDDSIIDIVRNYKYLMKISSGDRKLRIRT